MKSRISNIHIHTYIHNNAISSYIYNKLNCQLNLFSVELIGIIFCWYEIMKAALSNMIVFREVKDLCKLHVTYYVPKRDYWEWGWNCFELHRCVLENRLSPHKIFKTIINNTFISFYIFFFSCMNKTFLWKLLQLMALTQWRYSFNKHNLL